MHVCVQTCAHMHTHTQHTHTYVCPSRHTNSHNHLCRNTHQYTLPCVQTCIHTLTCPNTCTCVNAHVLRHNPEMCILRCAGINMQTCLGMYVHIHVRVGGTHPHKPRSTPMLTLTVSDSPAFTHICYSDSQMPHNRPVPADLTADWQMRSSKIWLLH